MSDATITFLVLGAAVAFFVSNRVPVGVVALILVEVVTGSVPCRVARRVLKTQYRIGSQGDVIQAALPWRCARAEGLIVCHKYSGTEHKSIRARFPRE